MDSLTFMECATHGTHFLSYSYIKNIVVLYNGILVIFITLVLYSGVGERSYSKFNYDLEAHSFRSFGLLGYMTSLFRKLTGIIYWLFNKQSRRATLAYIGSFLLATTCFGFFYITTCTALAFTGFCVKMLTDDVSYFKKIVRARIQDAAITSLDIDAKIGYLQLTMDLCFLVRDFGRATSGFDRLEFLYRFVRNYYTLKEQFDIIKLAIKPVVADGLEAHSLYEGVTFENAHSILDNWKDLTESDIVYKTQRMLKVVFFSGMASKLGLKYSDSSVEFLLGKSSKEIQFTSMNSLIFSSFELALMFCETGYECFVEKSLRPVLVRDRALRNWAASVQDIRNKVDKIPSDGKISPQELIEEMDLVLGRGNALMITNPKFITPLWKKLMEMRSSLARRFNASSTRRPPFSVLINGSPGIGKSSVGQMIATIYHRTVVDAGIYPDLEWEPSKNNYSYNSNSKYWDGYQGATQWCITLDDIAREHPNVVKNGQCPIFGAIIDMVNVQGIATTQAALEDKGVIPLIPKLTIATTNTKHLNASLAMSEPTAVLRRFPYIITPYLKPEYQDQYGMMRKDLGEVTRDAWDFHIETFGITRNTGTMGPSNLRGTYTTYYPEPGRDRCTASELSQFIHKAVLKHERSSDILMESLKVEDTTTMCKHGVLSYWKCNQCDSALVPHSYIPWWVPSWSPDPNKQLPLRHWLCYKFLDAAFEYGTEEQTIAAVTFVLAGPDGFQIYISWLADRTEKIFPNEFLVARRAFIAFLCTVGTVGIYKMVSAAFPGKLELEAQSDPSESSETTKVPNIWKKSVHPNVNFKVPVTTKSDNLDELCSSVRKSYLRLSIRGDGYSETVSGVCVGNSKYLFPAHPFSVGDTWQCIADYGYSQHHVTSKIGFKILRNDIISLGNDLCLIHCVSLLPRKNILPFFPAQQDMVTRSGYIVNLDAGGLVRTKCHTSYFRANAEYVHKSGKTIIADLLMGERHDRFSVFGDCGSLMLSETRDGFVITGMQVAGATSGKIIGFSQISQQLCDVPDHPLALSALGDFAPQYMRGSKSSGPLCEPYHKGVHVYAQHCDALLLGSYKGGVSSKSHVAPTMISKEVCKSFQYVNEYGPPPMKGFLRGDIWYNPWTIATEAQGTISPHFNQDEVYHVAKCFVEETTIDSSWLRKVRNFDTDVAINGIDGEPFIDSIPMNTSGGFFFPGEKRKYFVLDQRGRYVMGPELRSHYDELRAQLASGNRSNTVFNGTLKDEARPERKNLIGATRVFSACDVAFSIIVREQYLGVAQAMMIYNYISECAVGMNAYTDWDKLGSYLTTFGDDRMIAGDYKNYDKQIPPLFIRAAFFVLDQWRAVNGISSEDALISRGIATDIAFPILNMNKELIQFFGGNPSGHPLTALINSVANSLFMRFCYHKLGLDVSTFKQNVKLMTLGDDNVMGSNEERFNHTSISTILKEHGVTYTMADKQQASIPFIGIGDVDFLKRTFTKDYRGKYMARLNPTSILKSLTIWVQSPHVSPFKHLADCYLSARREWSLYDEDTFNRNVARMETIFNIPEFRNVRYHFVKRHLYDYFTTRDWVEGCLVQPSDDNQIDIEHVNLTCLEE